MTDQRGSSLEAEPFLATGHHLAVVRFLREFMPDGWTLPLTKQHDGSHSVLSRMALAGVLVVEKQPGAWTYRAASDV